jgi:tetratricopeptide (TPR) repeat protein
VRARLAPDAAVATGTTVALDTLLEKVRVFGGRVAEFGRGGMLAIFGLDPVEDAPRRAANAALAAIKTLERAEPAAPLPRVGLHVAEGLIGRVDADVEVDADDRDQARGALDELAAAAPPGAVVVSVAAVPFIRRWFETEDEGAGRRIVGRERAIGSGASLVPFVGRAHELRQLAVALERATAGTGGAVGVTGEAGLGKTRLLLEFRGSLHGRDVTWIEGRCLSYTASTPYVPLLGVLRSLCGIDDADDAVTVAERLRATLAAVGLDEDDAAAVLLHLLGVRSAPPAPEPDVVRRRLLETLRDLLLRHGRRRPLVVAIEDLHWADPSSRECLASLVDVVSSGPILALFTYRPGNAPPWLGSSFASQIALSPLPLEDSARLVAAVLGAEGATRPVTDRILARGEGNPFFLEELARAVRDRDERALDAAPQTVEDVLRARIDWLAADDRDALQRAAVVGKDVAPDLLAGIADAPADAVRAATRRLAAGEFLQLTASGHYTFTHALTHEVAYATIPEDRRRELHARAVDVLVQRHGEDRAEQAEKLADHARRAMRWEAAAYYARLAGDKALARSAYREAAERFRSALDALDRLPASREVTEQKINVHFALRTALTPLGEHGQIAEHLHEAERIARELQDDRRLGRVSAYLADYFRQVGEHQRAIAAGEEALAIARRLDDLPLEIAANLYIGQACDNVGRYRRALVFFRRNVELTAGEHGRSTFGLPFITSVQARTWVAGCLRELGEFPAGLAAAREAVEIAESANHPVSLAPASSVLGHLHLRMGEPARALASLERGRDLSQGSRLNLWLPVAESWLGLAYVGVGRSAEGLALLEAAVARERSMERLAHHSARLAALGDGYAAVGRWKEARDEVTRALDLARRQGERGNEAHALRLHGEIAFRQDGADLAAAVTFLEAALTLAAELEMAPVAARCRLGLAAVARQRHDDENARRHLDAACALLGAFGAPALLEAADALRRD